MVNPLACAARLGAVTLTCALSCSCTLATAAAPPTAAPDSPTLAAIVRRDAVRLGYRESAVPFSYAVDGKPMGYAIDLCKRLVEAIAQQAKVRQLVIEWVAVTSANRIERMKQGEIDLECGSTTNTADRRRQVAFTIPHYVAGVRILSRATAAVTTPSALEGKSVSTNKGSTAAELLDDIDKRLRTPVRRQLFNQSTESFAAVERGEAAAWVHDDIQLFSQRALSARPTDYVISGVHLSVEPLAIMLPRDDAGFKALVDRTMKGLMRSGEAGRLYAKWFESPIPPKGVNLQVPLNALTRDVYRAPTDFVPDLRILKMQ